jgi:predicted N-acetyltransferase YhbS
VKIDIKYLADHPEVTPTLAGWFYEEWGNHSLSSTMEAMEERIRRRMNRDRLPLTIVAFINDELVGSATLKIREMETHPHFEHWLGSVYVQEKSRGLGIGSELVKAGEEEAKRFNIQELYLYTRDKEPFYARLGWVPIERPFYHGREVVIMRRRIGA